MAAEANVPPGTISAEDELFSRFSHQNWRAAKTLLRENHDILVKDAASNLTRARGLLQRVGTWEVAVLDKEIATLLEGIAGRSLAGIAGVRHEYNHVHNEVNTQNWTRLAVHFALYCGTVLINRQTPGQVLQNLRFRDERLFHALETAGSLRIRGDSPSLLQRLLWGMMEVIIPYGWPIAKPHIERFLAERIFASEISMEEQAAKSVAAAENFAKILTVINMFHFLRHGVYSRMTDRILKMRQVPVKAQGARSLAFDFLDRQLLFSEISNFAITLLPAIRIMQKFLGPRIALFLASVKRLVRHFGLDSCWRKRSARKMVLGDTPNAVRARIVHMGNGVLMPCAWCAKEHPEMPYVTSCGCTFCYLCLRLNLVPRQVKSKNEKMRAEAPCPSCGARMYWSRRWEHIFGKTTQVK